MNEQEIKELRAEQERFKADPNSWLEKEAWERYMASQA